MTKKEIAIAANKEKRGYPLKPKDRQILEHLRYKEDISLAVLANRVPNFTGRLRLSGTFYLEANKKGDIPGDRGDLGNYVKLIEDGLQSAGVMKNDKEIVSYGHWEISPCYEGEERAEITLEEYIVPCLEMPSRTASTPRTHKPAV
jgi:Holliday junction resolvase RusA-like endonuclease